MKPTKKKKQNVWISVRYNHIIVSYITVVKNAYKCNVIKPELWPYNLLYSHNFTYRNKAKKKESKPLTERQFCVPELYGLNGTELWTIWNRRREFAFYIYINWMFFNESDNRKRKFIEMYSNTSEITMYTQNKYIYAHSIRCKSSHKKTIIAGNRCKIYSTSKCDFNLIQNSRS